MNLDELLLKLGDKTVLIDYDDYPIDDHTVRDSVKGSILSCITPEVYTEIKQLIGGTNEISKDAFWVAVVASSFKKDIELRNALLTQLKNQEDGNVIRETLSACINNKLSGILIHTIEYFLTYNIDTFYASGIHHSALLLLGDVKEKELAIDAMKNVFKSQKSDRDKESVIIAAAGLNTELSISFLKSTAQNEKTSTDLLDCVLSSLVRESYCSHQWICDFILQKRSDDKLVYSNSYKFRDTFLIICISKNIIFKELLKERLMVLFQIENRVQDQRVYIRHNTDRLEALKIMCYFEINNSSVEIKSFFQNIPLSEPEQEWYDINYL